jgi:hypothetical protein
MPNQRIEFYAFYLNFKTASHASSSFYRVFFTAVVIACSELLAFLMLICQNETNMRRIKMMLKTILCIGLL